MSKLFNKMMDKAIRTADETKYVNGFEIAKIGNYWAVFNSAGILIRKCKTYSEAVQRITEQTI